MTITPLAESGEALLHVARNMREWDRREIFATRWLATPEALAHDIFLFKDFGWILGLNGEPIVAIGAVPGWPGIWSVWMFATDRITLIGKKMTTFVRRGMIPALLGNGCHRAECHSMEGHTEAHRWLELLGARREAKVPRFGKDRENFYLYSWLPDTNITTHYVADPNAYRKI